MASEEIQSFVAETELLNPRLSFEAPSHTFLTSTPCSRVQYEDLSISTADASNLKWHRPKLDIPVQIQLQLIVALGTVPKRKSYSVSEWETQLSPAPLALELACAEPFIAVQVCPQSSISEYTNTEAHKLQLGFVHF